MERPALQPGGALRPVQPRVERTRRRGGGRDERFGHRHRRRARRPGDQLAVCEGIAAAVICSHPRARLLHDFPPLPQRRRTRCDQRRRRPGRPVAVPAQRQGDRRPGRLHRPRRPPRPHRRSRPRVYRHRHERRARPDGRLPRRMRLSTVPQAVRRAGFSDAEVAASPEPTSAHTCGCVPLTSVRRLRAPIVEVAHRTARRSTRRRHTRRTRPRSPPPVPNIRSPTPFPFPPPAPHHSVRRQPDSCHIGLGIIRSGCSSSEVTRPVRRRVRIVPG